MKVITDIRQMQAWSQRVRSQGKSIGFVPTMGYLHEGHLSLMRKAKAENDYLVISIFVNPTQFGPREDFRQYPRNFNRDKKLARLSGVHVIFHPQARQMYPQGYNTEVDVGDLGKRLCGKSRPGHFRGVATVVLKLFNIVAPTRAYFGQKDAQQALIIRKMIADLNLGIILKVLPIVRQSDGLAISSRNLYLSRRQRAKATILYCSLQTAVGMIQSGNKAPREIVSWMREMIKSRRATRIDYIKIVDAHSLEEVNRLKGDLLIAVAVFFGHTRLIDNMQVYLE